MNAVAAVFVDGENMHYTLNKLGWKIRFPKLLDYIKEDLSYTIYNAFYYTGQSRTDTSGRIRFLNNLSLNGFTVRRKHVKIIKDNSGNVESTKCNLDIEIAIDMLDTVPLYDVAILMSGDSDFVEVIKRIRTKGKKTICISEKGYSAIELINEVDQFILLSSIKDKIKAD